MRFIDCKIFFLRKMLVSLKTAPLQHGVKVSIAKFLAGKYVVRCAIWYDLYNFKNVKNIHGGVLILVKLQAPNRATHHIYELRYLLRGPHSNSFMTEAVIM